MWFEADEIVELFRGYIPYYLLIALPIFIIISPVNPVGASHEFPVYRMQQYDLHGVTHGKAFNCLCLSYTTTDWFVIQV
jgi:hypothetical protein